MKTPVLLIAFNRPETSAKVLAAIRQAKPEKLYISIDGPRDGNECDRTRVAATRRLSDAVDWNCEVKTVFHERNLGCKYAPVSAIDWFFKSELEGIVLEDDVVPCISFFRFCEELLERYRDDHRVGTICGGNLTSSKLVLPGSYGFSTYPLIWGWATWRRAWHQYDVNMDGWAEWVSAGGLRTISSNPLVRRHWFMTLRAASSSANRDAWDFQWLFASIRAQMLSIIPSHNLTQNIGFGSDATHTNNGIPRYVKDSLPRNVEFPLVHPNTVEVSGQIDRAVEEYVYGITPLRMAKREIVRTLLRRG
jgi:hypothetical protein